MNPRTALITGASSGIGEAVAEVFAAEGFDLVITARREDRLRAVAARVRERHGVQVHVMPADLSERDAPAGLCNQVAERGVRIDALVNNAGYGIPGIFIASDWPRQAALLQVMIVALAELTHVLLPGMIDRGYGRIINVASLAALVPAPPGHTLYAASKDGPQSGPSSQCWLVGSRSDPTSSSSSRRRSQTRCSRSGVHVTALCPGFTFSEFHDVTGTRATVKQLPAWLWMDASSVARQGFDAVMARAPVYVPGKVNRTIAFCTRYFPKPLIVALGRRTAWRYRNR